MKRVFERTAIAGVVLEQSHKIRNARRVERRARVSLKKVDRYVCESRQEWRWRDCCGIRCRAAEFSGVQLHAAHGYLLSQFLSPYQNRRKDRWGGSIANRFHMMAEIIQGARQRVGDYSIWVKISAHDGHRNGMRVEEAIEIARMLQDVGCDARGVLRQWARI